MMIFTHILIGGALASIISTELILAGFLGGLLPDLDALADHRKTLHFPYYYGIAGISALVSYYLVESPLWLQTSIFFFLASIHCFSDTLGGGLEHRPWEETDDRGVYSHLQYKWLKTRHWVYDGSKGDLALSITSGSICCTKVFSLK